VVVAHEPPHRLGEAADLIEQPGAPFGMALNDGVLCVVERAGLLEDHVGHCELADVVQQPADRERAKVPLGEAEALTDLNGPERDTAGVLLSVGVAPPELA
jgi:hypothetical protein